jgi:hypothetical protein
VKIEELHDLDDFEEGIAKAVAILYQGADGAVGGLVNPF